MHAAGVLIGDRPLSELVPLERRVGGPLFTQWDRYGVESVGLLKMDFRGVISMLDTYNWMFLSATPTSCWMAELPPSEFWFDEEELDVIPVDRCL